MRSISALTASLVLFLSSFALAQTYECTEPLGTGCSTPLRDNAASTSSIFVLAGDCASDARIVDLDVRIKVAHQSVGDLSFTLTHPNGRSVQFGYRPEFSATTGGCVGDDLDVTYSDESAVSAPTCAFTIPSLTGSLRTFNPLSVFDGMERNGEWTLMVEDHEAPGYGALESWSLVMPCTLPAVTISATQPDAAEGGENAVVTVTREGPTDHEVMVSYTVSGDALAAADYEPLPGKVAIPAGEASATFEVKALVDSQEEDAETLVITLASGEYTFGAANAAAVNLVDVTCGNVKITGPETCDDGNVVDGDDCSATCQVESAEEDGCGCRSTPAAVQALALLALVGLVASRRRAHG